MLIIPITYLMNLQCLFYWKPCCCMSYIYLLYMKCLRFNKHKLTTLEYILQIIFLKEKYDNVIQYYSTFLQILRIMHEGREFYPTAKMTVIT